MDFLVYSSLLLIHKYVNNRFIIDDLRPFMYVHLPPLSSIDLINRFGDDFTTIRVEPRDPEQHE